MIRAHDMPPLGGEVSDAARANVAVADMLYELVSRPAVQRRGAAASDLLIRAEAARRLAHYQAEQGS